MRIFVIGGKACSGKNTVANIIKNHYDKLGKKTIITGYSKYIKLYAHEMLGWNYDEKKKPRKFLQDMGDKVRKDLGSDFLIKRMIDDIKIYSCFYDNIIISDARLINEIEYLKEYYLNVVSIYIYNERDNGLSSKEKKHITEIELEDYNDFDYNIEYVSYEQLYSDINLILEDVE